MYTKLEWLLKQFSEAFYCIQVILDVVFNHSNEADDKNPFTTSFRGIDNKVIYSLFCSFLLLGL